MGKEKIDKPILDSSDEAEGNMGTLLDARDIRSHPPSGREVKERIENMVLPDLSKVEELAACGLSKEEIWAELDFESKLDSLSEAQVESAIKSGRYKGSALIKKAQHKSALEGKPSAQSSLLKRLSEPEGEEDFIVEREVAGVDESEEKT